MTCTQIDCMQAGLPEMEQVVRSSAAIIKFKVSPGLHSRHNIITTIIRCAATCIVAAAREPAMNCFAPGGFRSQIISITTPIWRISVPNVRSFHFLYYLFSLFNANYVLRQRCLTAPLFQKKLLIAALWALTSQGSPVKSGLLSTFCDHFN